MKTDLSVSQVVSGINYVYKVISAVSVRKAMTSASR